MSLTKQTFPEVSVGEQVRDRLGQRCVLIAIAGQIEGNEDRRILHFARDGEEWHSVTTAETWARWRDQR